jgi:hypothetical protein
MYIIQIIYYTYTYYLWTVWNFTVSKCEAFTIAYRIIKSVVVPFTCLDKAFIRDPWSWHPFPGVFIPEVLKPIK